MAIVPLSEINDEYQLVHSDQDIYGWPVVNASGAELGTVAELLVDTDAERVSSIVLDTHEEYPASDITIGDGVVRVSAKAAARPARPLDNPSLADAAGSGTAFGVAGAQDSDTPSYDLPDVTAERNLEPSDVAFDESPAEHAFERDWAHVRRRVRDTYESTADRETNSTAEGRPMAIDNEDLRREEETDAKVGVVKDAKRVAHGDVAGVVHDDVEEMKADFHAADDKVKEMLGSDEKE